MDLGTKKQILDKYTTNFILNYYPSEKQKSDDTDWKIYSSKIIAESNGSITMDTIFSKIYEAASKILQNQSTFDQELQKLISFYNNQEAWAQLLKAGIRTGWVQLIKYHYNKILNDDTIPVEKLYYVVRQTFPPLTKFLPK